MSDALFDVAARVVLVAGGANGLGRAIAVLLAARGALVEVLDHSASALAALQGAAPGVVTHEADITDESAIGAVIADIYERRGSLWGLVNCAGILRIADALELPLAEFRASLEINVTGAFILSRTAAARMLRSKGGAGGRIVHLSSVSSLVSNPRYAAYASSKAALSHLVRVLGREWAQDGVNINAIGPAMTETGMTAAHLDDPLRRAAALSVIPMGRFGTPDDLIGAVIYLLSPAGAFVTGQTLYVDGGRTLA